MERRARYWDGKGFCGQNTEVIKDRQKKGRSNKEEITALHEGRNAN